MNTEIEAIDNDGDSLDNDGDGYPNGQEKLLGTNPDEAEDYPIGVEPDPPEKWINEDDINWTIFARRREIMLGKMTMEIVWNITILQAKETHQR